MFGHRGDRGASGRRVETHWYSTLYPRRASSAVRWFTTSWVQQAPSMVISRRRRAPSRAAIDASMIAMWSVAVLEPALPVVP